MKVHLRGRKKLSIARITRSSTAIANEFFAETISTQLPISAVPHWLPRICPTRPGPVNDLVNRITERRLERDEVTLVTSVVVTMLGPEKEVLRIVPLLVFVTGDEDCGRKDETVEEVKTVIPMDDCV